MKANQSVGRLDHDDDISGGDSAGVMVGTLPSYLGQRSRTLLLS